MGPTSKIENTWDFILSLENRARWLTPSSIWKIIVLTHTTLYLFKNEMKKMVLNCGNREESVISELKGYLPLKEAIKGSCRILSIEYH